MVGVEPVVQLVKLPVASAGSTVAITGVFSGAPLTVAAVSSRGKSVESVGKDAASAFRLLYRVKAAVPPRLVAPLLLAAAQLPDAVSITTPQLLPEPARAAELVEAFNGRSVLLRGRVGHAARLDLDAVSASGPTHSPR
jgi:RNA 3'-terminal phosphate cyclase